MASKQQIAGEISPILQEIAEMFRCTIFNQNILLALAKKTVLDERLPTIEALVISIDRFNDDLFRLYERLNDLTECDAAKGGAR